MSDSSLQFELKHTTRAMSLYYGQNYSRLRLEQTANFAYVKAGYEAIGRKLQELTNDRFVSPHGGRRKDELVRLITANDLKECLKLAKRGGVACREVILGVCMNEQPCPYGGIDSVAHCGGGHTGKACSEVLYDREKVAQVRAIQKTLEEQARCASENSPLFLSLQAQIISTKNFLLRIEKEKEDGC